MIEKRIVIAQEAIEPNVGIKLKQKARNAQTRGKSILVSAHAIKIKIPVKSEITNLIEM